MVRFPAFNFWTGWPCCKVWDFLLFFFKVYFSVSVLWCLSFVGTCESSASFLPLCVYAVSHRRRLCTGVQTMWEGCGSLLELLPICTISVSHWMRKLSVRLAGVPCIIRVWSYSNRFKGKNKLMNIKCSRRGSLICTLWVYEWVGGIIFFSIF